MKKFPMILMASALAVFLVAGSAMALTLDYFTGVAGDSQYSDTGAEYVFLTDLQTPESAPMIELSSTILSIYDHDYIIGLFEWDGSSVVADLCVLDTFQSVTSSNVIFDLNTGTVTSAIDMATMGTTFGFFLQFYTDIGSGILSNEIYYSDDAVNGGTDVFSIFYDPLGIASTGYSEVALGVGGPSTQGHALVSVDDVAPVPEPASMLLLGSGLFGLAGIGRKKFFKKA